MLNLEISAMVLSFAVPTLLALAVPSQPQACAYDEAKEQVVASSSPQSRYEAGDNPAFRAADFSFGGETYVKYGNPRPFTPAELRPYTKMGSAMLFIDAGFNEDVLYVLTRSAGCMFQPYFRKKPSR
jgi:hypothetical protein